jgi:hypothetical protein
VQPHSAIPLVALLLTLAGSAAAAPQTGWPFMGGTDIAYDPVYKVYLRVGGEPQLLGEFVDEFGIRIGNPFQISTSTDDALYPRVVYSEHDPDGGGGFLVIWTRRTPPPVYGDANDPTYRPSTFTLRSRRVTYIARGPSGSEQLIGDQGQADALPMLNGATLAYSPSRRVFFAAYERLVSTGPTTSDCCSLHGVVLNVNGAPKFPAIEIESAVALPRYPAMEWNPTANSFGVAYSVQGFIHFAVVDTESVLEERKVLQPLIDVYKWERPDVAVNTTLGRYLVAWAENFVGGRQTQTAEVDFAGNVLRSSRVSQMIKFDPRVAFNAASNTFLLVGAYEDPSHLQAQELDANGVRSVTATDTLDFGGGVRFGFPVGEGTLTVDQTRGINYANRAVWDARVRPAPGNRRWVVSYFSSDRLTSQMVTLPSGELTAPSPLWTIYQQVSFNKGQYAGVSTVGFTWSGGGAGAQYWLDMGRQHGGAEFYSGFGPSSGSMNVAIPLTGQPLYVRLWTLQSGQWSYLDYVLPTPRTPAAAKFDWQPLATTSDSWLYVSHQPGGGFGEYHYSREPAGATSRVVSPVPIQGNTQTDYVRVYSRLADRWVSRDFLHTALTPRTPMLYGPVPGATMMGSNLALAWAAAAGTQNDWLDIGTTPGGSNLYSGSQFNRPAKTLTVPLNGGTIWARLWSYGTPGVPQWKYVDYAWPTINAGGRAVLTAPAFGTLLAQPTERFTWSPVASATQYWLDIGTAAGGADVYSATQGLNTTATVSGLPVTARPIESDGRPLFVRLWSLTPDGGWTFVDSEYQTAAPTKEATLLQPTHDGPITGSTATFAWQKPAGTTQVWLDVGTAEGMSNLYSQGSASATSATVSGLPTGGAPVHARLWTEIGGQWRFVDYVFVTQ